MQNSRLPLMMMAVVGCMVLFMIKPGQPPGANGPDIFEGIYRLPTKDLVPSLPDLACDNRETVAAVDDRRIGLEPDWWRTVVIAADDRSAMGRAVVLALAEQLTARGCIAIIQIQSPDPYLMPADRVVRVTAPETQPNHPGEEFTTAIGISELEPRFADGHLASRVQPAVGIRAMSFTINHHSAWKGGGEVPQWPAWYATVGRSIASKAIAVMAGGETLPRDWTGLKRAEWPVRLPLPPRSEIVRWHGACQHELVRGWSGFIRGHTTLDSAGGEQPTVVPLEKLMKSGFWEECTAPGEKLRTWKRADDKTKALSWFSAVPSATGWNLAMWQEWPEPAGVHEDWLNQAKKHDSAYAARQQLRRHLLCAGIVDDQQAKALAVLRQDPSLDELAMIGHLPTASAAEKAASQAVEFVRGVSDAAPAAAGSWRQLAVGGKLALSPVTANRGVDPGALMQAGDALVLVVLTADGGDCYARPLTGGAPALRVGLGVGATTVALAKGKLVVSGGAAAQVEWQGQ